ncbi:MAG: citrate/2-methylcitrate synthase [Candidatus Thorarchaeota archaeon]
MVPISRIDPTANQLYFRGINAVDLARSRDYESVLFLLVNGNLPTDDQKRNLISRMNQFRDLYTEDMKSLESLIDNLPSLTDENDLSNHDTLLAYVSLCPIVIANQFVISRGEEVKIPHKGLGHAANFLWQARGISPMERDLRDFQNALILPMDDPDNPSLSALIAAYEGRRLEDSLQAALKAHVGPLHHGAGTLAMEMFDEIQKPENTKAHLERRLSSGKKIFGLGHRIYTGIDPRAVELREMLQARTEKTCDEWILHVADTVAKVGGKLLAKHKGIEAYPNIDLYNAAVYYTFGFPPEMNTALFAISRAAGWMAHLLEIEQ